MVTFWLNGEETSSETESALEQGGKEKDYVIKVQKCHRISGKYVIHFLRHKSYV